MFGIKKQKNKTKKKLEIASLLYKVAGVTGFEAVPRVLETYNASLFLSFL